MYSCCVSVVTAFLFLQYTSHQLQQEILCDYKKSTKALYMLQVLSTFELQTLTLYIIKLFQKQQSMEVTCFKVFRFYKFRPCSFETTGFRLTSKPFILSIAFFIIIFRFLILITTVYAATSICTCLRVLYTFA